jgi:hypothetical protein
MAAAPHRGGEGRGAHIAGSCWGSQFGTDREHGGPWAGDLLCRLLSGLLVGAFGYVHAEYARPAAGRPGAPVERPGAVA